MRLSILGPPGAGKGTQAKRIAREYGLEHLSTGELLRTAIGEGTALGRRVEPYVTSGRLVPDELVSGVVAEFLESREDGRGYILDGFPRTLAQAEALERMAEEERRSLDRAIHLTLADEAALERITGRRVCPKCGREYHVRFRPPKEGGRCDDDGAPLVQRADDREEAVRERLAAYHRQVEPVLGYYRERGLLSEVDGSGSVDAVFERIRGILKQRPAAGRGAAFRG